MADTVGQGDAALFRRVLWDARRFWPHIGVLFVVELLATPLALLTPLPLKLVIDNVLGGQPVPELLRPIAPDPASAPTAMLLFAGALLVLVAAMARLQTLLATLLQTYVSERITLGFRARIFRHLQRLSFTYHDVSGTADAVYRVQYDAPAISRIAVSSVTPLIAAAVTLVAMIYVTAQIAAEMALIALAVAPALVVLARISRRTLRHRWRRVKRLEKSSMSVVEEVLANLRVVKGFGQEEREQERYVDAAGVTLVAKLRVQAVEGLVGFLTSLATAAGTAIVLVYGALQVQTGRLSLGDLVLVMGYMAQLYAPLKTLTESVTSLQSSLASAERSYGVLDETADVPEAANPRRIERTTGAVRLENVTFWYERSRPIILRATLDVPPGSRVGIQGRTGSGKSTLISLLMRFYDPTIGRILLDGVDLREYRVADLRDQFAIVLQEPVLFSRTIGENIAYARPAATKAEIMQAARDARAHEFISRLPRGYDTLVGERGMTLSGGERQRISIARAFLKDAPILILDEPTSAVDTATEVLIVDAMERLMADRTTFIIAHRLSTLESCDIRIELVDVREAALMPAAVIGSTDSFDLRPPRTAAGLLGSAR